MLPAVANFPNKIGTIETKIQAGFDLVSSSSPIGRANNSPLAVKGNLVLVFILMIGITKTIEYLLNPLVAIMVGPNKTHLHPHLQMDPHQVGMNA